MKKFLGILAVFAVAFFVFGLVSKKAGANKTVFGSGQGDDHEKAKEISLGILRDRAARRAIGNPEDFDVKRVEIDELKMAHTHVQQKISGVPVWEGEAIVHLKSDGELSLITDDLKESVAVNTQPNFSVNDALRLASSNTKGTVSYTHLTLPTIYSV